MHTESKPTRERVGTWLQTEEQDTIYQGSYAGHNESWRLHVAETPILRCLGRPYRHWVTAARVATRTGYSFHNRIGSCGSTRTDNAPKLGTHSIQLDGYALARAVDKGQARLADGWTIRTVGEYSSGDPMRRVYTPEGEAL